MYDDDPELDPLPETATERWEADLHQHHEAYVRATYRRMVAALDQHDIPIGAVSRALTEFGQIAERILREPRSSAAAARLVDANQDTNFDRVAGLLERVLTVTAGGFGSAPRAPRAPREAEDLPWPAPPPPPPLLAAPPAPAPSALDSALPDSASPTDDGGA